MKKPLSLLPRAKLTWKDFLKFSNAMLVTGDIDPVYPVLIHLTREMDKEDALWLSFLYVAWYNLPVGATAFDLGSPSPELLPQIDWSWPTGIERRANRGGKVVFHIESYLKQVKEHGSQWQYYTAGLNMEAKSLAHRQDNWRIVNQRLQTIHLNGRWAAYKHCEIIRRVHGLPMEAPDMGNAFSSGPRQGLALFYGEVEGNSPDAIALLDRQGEDLIGRMDKWGVTVDIEELETLMCNWKSLVNGKYYIGHDIDELLEQIHVGTERGWLPEHVAQEILEARKQSLPHAYLGEIRGWHGVDKKRMKAYKERGKVLIRRGPDA